MTKLPWTQIEMSLLKDLFQQNTSRSIIIEQIQKITPTRTKDSIIQKLSALQLTKPTSTILVAGQILGHWTILDPKSISNKIKCKCACGSEKLVLRAALLNGRSSSCGCKRLELCDQTCFKKYGTKRASQLEETKIKINNTSIERYGTKRASQTSEVQAKIDRTNFALYGARRFSQTHLFQLKLTDIHKQTLTTHFVKYGMHSSSLPINKDRLKAWAAMHPQTYTSKAELQLMEWVKQYYPNATKYRDANHELDIFIPELNLGIEYNGLVYHNTDHKVKMYHRKKLEYFKEKGIKTIFVWEPEWQYTSHRSRLISFLKSTLQLNDIRIGARQVNIVWSQDEKEKNQSSALLHSYHLQGIAKHIQYTANAYYNNELVATATFGLHHRGTGEWVLSRFCTKEGVTICGLLSKISKLASEYLKSDIISWADYRLSTGNGYLKAGWTLDKILPPDYFYHKGLRIISKQSRQKSIVNTPDGMTELQHAKLDKLGQIYDCGKLRFVYKYGT